MRAREALSEDYGRGKPAEVAKDVALQDIQAVLQLQGKRNSDFDGLPDPAGFDRELWLNADLEQELKYDVGAERGQAATMREKM